VSVSRPSEVTLVTGPLRSGTSCLTGLLEQCGFDLGTNLDVLRAPSPHNPLGHFECSLLLTINKRLLLEADGRGELLRVPTLDALARLAPRRENYFKLFIREFDGDLCKDPLMCLTLPFWEPRWPALTRVVYCLRHPLAVARSMSRRYEIDVPGGLEAWLAYTRRLLDAPRRAAFHVFCFDNFQHRPVETLGRTLLWLRRPLDPESIRQKVASFYNRDHIHWAPDDSDLPPQVEAVYRDLLRQSVEGGESGRASKPRRYREIP